MVELGTEKQTPVCDVIAEASDRLYRVLKHKLHRIFHTPCDEAEAKLHKAEIRKHFLEFLSSINAAYGWEDRRHREISNERLGKAFLTIFMEDPDAEFAVKSPTHLEMRLFELDRARYPNHPNNNRLWYRSDVNELVSAVADIVAFLIQLLNLKIHVAGTCE